MTQAAAQANYPCGAAYDGQWSLDGEKHGIGALTFQDGSKYEGEFSRGFSAGHGVMVFPDGSRFVLFYSLDYVNCTTFQCFPGACLGNAS